MSEEELIEKIQDEVELLNIDDRVLEISPKLQKELAKNIQGLLDLYNKEKEKNKILELTKIPYLEGEIMAYKENNAVQRKMLNDAFDRGWIHKDKVREFALSESQADTYNFKTISLDRLLKFLEEK